MRREEICCRGDHSCIAFKLVWCTVDLGNEIGFLIAGAWAMISELERLLQDPGMLSLRMLSVCPRRKTSSALVRIRNGVGY